MDLLALSIYLGLINSAVSGGVFSRLANISLPFCRFIPATRRLNPHRRISTQPPLTDNFLKHTFEINMHSKEHPLAILSEKFFTSKILGEGAQGTAYLCTSADNKKFVVLKELNKIYNWREEDNLLEEKEKTFSILNSISHENIVKFLCHYADGPSTYEVYEYIPGISLEEYLKKNSKDITLADIRRILRQVLQAIECLIKNGLSHNDLHPGNIFMVGKKVVLIDFSSCSSLNPFNLPNVQNVLSYDLISFPALIISMLNSLETEYFKNIKKHILDGDRHSGGKIEVDFLNFFVESRASIAFRGKGDNINVIGELLELDFISLGYQSDEDGLDILK